MRGVYKKRADEPPAVEPEHARLSIYDSHYCFVDNYLELKAS